MIDTLAFFIFHPFELFFFYKCFPEFRDLKFLDHPELIEGEENQNRFYNLLCRYPEVRGVWALALSLVKVIPIGVYIAYVSEISFSFFQVLGLFYFIDLLVLIYNSSLMYIQFHTIASKFMADFAKLPNWISNYRSLRVDDMRDRFSIVQNLVLCTMMINLLLVVVCSTQLGFLTHWVSFSIMFVSAIICICAVQIQFQNYFTSSLKNLFDVFNVSLESKSQVLLPLHTSPLLAGFEYSFNQLGHKLEQREKEIANWLKRESEQFHLKALGEITALVAHDIKTPLHVMQMSMEVLNDPAASPAEKEKYSQILEKNLDQTITFTKSLMAHLKGVKDSNDCRFGDVHQHLLDLLSTQFSSQNFHIIDFDLSDELKEFRIGINRLDAMHVFYNIYHNAIRAVLEDSKPEKRIKLWTEENGAIYLYDNGPGLTKEEFSQFISYERFAENENFNRSLGLRLTHTLVNRLGGELELIPVSEGTCYKIRLPLAESSDSNWSQILQGQTAPLNVISQL